MISILQKKYNQNRLSQTLHAPSQSGQFFAIWRDKGIIAAIVSFYWFKREHQKLSYAGIRTASDLLGSVLVASGLTQLTFIATIAVILMISVGGSGDVVVEDGGPG